MKDFNSLPLLVVNSFNLNHEQCQRDPLLNLLDSQTVVNSLKAIQTQNRHEILTSMFFQPKFNLKIIFSHAFKQNMNFKIQILVGNTLMLKFHVSFEIAPNLT